MMMVKGALDCIGQGGVWYPCGLAGWQLLPSQEDYVGPLLGHRCMYYRANVVQSLASRWRRVG